MQIQNQALKAPPEVFRLVLYKFQLEAIKKNQQPGNIEKAFKDADIKHEVWYFDLPANLDLEKIQNKAFFEQKIELKKLDFQS